MRSRPEGWGCFEFRKEDKKERDYFTFLNGWGYDENVVIRYMIDWDWKTLDPLN